MGAIYILSCLLVVAICGGLLARAIFRRTSDVLSIRNLFLLGFMFFYGTAGLFFAFGRYTSENYTAQGSGPLILAASQLVFLGIFLLFDHYGRRWHAPTKLLPKVELTPSTPALLTCIAVMMTASIATLFIGVPGYLTVLVMQFRGGLATAAVALAMYYLLSQRYNPVTWIVFFVTLAFAALATTAGTSGRRDFVGVLAAILWVWYFASLRYRNLALLVPKLAIPAAIGIAVLIGYSGIRHDVAKDATIGQRAGQFKQVLTNPAGVTSSGLTALLAQDTPANSTYIIENYPENYERKPLIGAVYVLGMPVPRSIWPTKPMGLGIEIMDQLNAPANLAPGIIGHGWYELGIIGIVYYAMFFGLYCGVLDRALLFRAGNPFFVAALGAALGNTIALPRGDTPLFFTQVLAAYAAVFGVLIFLNIVFGTVFRGFAPLAPPLPAGAYESDQRDWDGWDGYADQDDDRAARNA